VSRASIGSWMTVGTRGTSPPSELSTDHALVRSGARSRTCRSRRGSASRWRCPWFLHNERNPTDPRGGQRGDAAWPGGRRGWRRSCQRHLGWREMQWPTLGDPQVREAVRPVASPRTPRRRTRVNDRGHGIQVGDRSSVGNLGRRRTTEMTCVQTGEGERRWTTHTGCCAGVTAMHLH
jgi:hypothetical protein